ncbi:hypothetical protein [Planctomicrobium piriforme]|uniref:Uncharacterized protein n=1 Tax=Planctomicrobium piriforme TaxID=1576369 RepID=A0A1I3DGL4_9PLAN|nr:hypothetical protein [Planctomicrobium piriforme]SFH85874.1 hypothetical protein SAMN05421753_103232 [Planctomicrobium piriforme]
MSFSPDAIDRIVANVLSQLGQSAAAPRAVPSGEKTTLSPVVKMVAAAVVSTGVMVIDGSVVTAESLENVSAGASISVLPKAIVTPAAQDVIRGRKLTLIRQAAPAASAETKSAAAVVTTSPLLIVVKNSKAVDQLWQELAGGWKREFLGCPDDAAKLATGEICRGGAGQVVILADQTHRAACLANRNEKVKAVAIRDAGDIRLIRKQLRANVWCLDTSARTYFELKNIFREIQTK